RRVELPVPAVVDAVIPAGHAGPGRDGADAGELRERGFAADAFGVVAGDDEDFGGGIDADPELVEQVRGTLEYELLDLRFEIFDLVVERDPAFRDRPE